MNRMPLPHRLPQTTEGTDQSKESRTVQYLIEGHFPRGSDRARDLNIFIGKSCTFAVWEGFCAPLILKLYLCWFYNFCNAFASCLIVELVASEGFLDSHTGPYRARKH